MSFEKEIADLRAEVAALRDEIRNGPPRLGPRRDQDDSAETAERVKRLVDAVEAELSGDTVRFRFSDDGKYAYRLGVGMRGFWLQVEPQPVGSVAAKCEGNFFLNGIRLKHPDAPDDPSREYEREKLPFNFWKVQSKQHIERDLLKTDLFVQDYLLHESFLEAQNRNR